MWERTLGVSHRTVGLTEVHAELSVVDVFVEYLLGLLDEKIREEVKMMSDKFDLGIRKDTGRLGVLFGKPLVDFSLSKSPADKS